MIIHKWDAQSKRGDESERYLDGYFDENFDIKHVTREGQRRGIDRIFTHKVTGERHTVEYKTDWKTQELHSVFVEVISVDARKVPGWAYTCTADLLFYYCPGEGCELVYVLEPPTIRDQLDRWKQLYPTKPSYNEGYKTWGICVPQHEFERYAIEVVSL